MLKHTCLFFWTKNSKCSISKICRSRKLVYKNYLLNMAKIKYIEFNGTEHEADVANGLSVMEGAIQNDIPGIDADCGGGMSCATCHVYINDDEWFRKLPEKEMGEDDMLDQAFEPKSNSRLSCQLIVSDDLDGLTVHMPEKQV